MLFVQVMLAGIYCAICAGVCVQLAAMKYRNPGGFAAAGMFFGLLGVFCAALALRGDDPAHLARVQRRAEHDAARAARTGAR